MDSASPDRREHKRYAVPDDAVSMCNGKVGRIINISDGGMAVNFILDEPFSEESEATILCRTNNLYIKDSAIEIVRKSDRPFASMGTFRIQTIGVKFNFSNIAQRDQIKEYVSRLSGRS